MTTKLDRTLIGRLGIPGAKALSEKLGLSGGPCRRPLSSLSEDDRAEDFESFDHATQERTTP